MKRFLTPAFLLLALSFRVPLQADEVPATTPVADYLAQLQIKLDHAGRRANQPTSAGGSSVVGLRGSNKSEPLSKQLYWKGKGKSQPVSPEEIRMVRGAVEQARVGQISEAMTALKSFQSKYPGSPLLADVQETLKRLSEMPPTPKPVTAS